MTSKQIKIISILTVFAVLVLAPTAQAAFVTCGGHNADGTIQNPCQLSDLILIVVRIINYLFTLAGFVAMVFIVWASWGMITAGGNEEKIAGAKTVFSQAIIGLFLVLISFLLIDAIVALLGGFTLKELFGIATKIPFPPAQ